MEFSQAEKVGTLVWDPLSLVINNVSTLTVTDTETDKFGRAANGNLCWYLSLYSVNTSIQLYASHFVSVLLSDSVNTQLLTIRKNPSIELFNHTPFSSYILKQKCLQI